MKSYKVRIIADLYYDTEKEETEKEVIDNVDFILDYYINAGVYNTRLWSMDREDIQVKVLKE